jgi:ribose 5-phosphate isomerase B
VPYTKCADRVAKAVQSGEAERGFLFCGTGMGMSITANKHKGVYCALVESQWAAKKSRIVNDVNILAMGASIIGPTMAKDIVDTFLETEFAENEPQERKKVLADFLEGLYEVEEEVFTD